MSNIKISQEDFDDVAFDDPRKKIMILGPTEKPGSIKTWIMLSLQHMFAMFGATVLVPFLVNNAPGVVGNPISTQVALFSSGVGTLIYIIATKAKVPIYLGSSVAFVGAISALYPIYGTSAFLGFVGAGIIYVFISIAIYFYGVKWLKNILSPIVVGPMIMIIGLSLAPIAISSIGLSKQALQQGVNWWGVAVGIITIIATMLIALLFRGRMKLIPILGGIGVGFIASLIVFSWHGNLIYDSSGNAQTMDWSVFKNNPTSVSTYIGVPNFKQTMLTGNHTPQPFSIMPLFLMMPIAFVSISEHIGDHTVLGRMINKDFIGGEPGLHRTLIGDGVATIFGGLIGGPANTSYGENTTVIGMSRVASTYVTGLAAIFAIILSFFSIVSNLLNVIPTPVLGGVEIILFGFIAANGLKILIHDQINLNDMKNMFVILTMLIIGIGGTILDFQLGNSDIKFEGMSLALIFGVLLDQFLPKDQPLKEHVFDSIKKGVNTKKKRL